MTDNRMPDINRAERAEEQVRRNKLTFTRVPGVAAKEKYNRDLLIEYDRFLTKKYHPGWDEMEMTHHLDDIDQFLKERES